MSDEVKWHGDEALKHVRARGIQFLTKAILAVERRAKKLLSIPGTGRSKGRTAGPITRSKPGEPPRKQTGQLRGSVTSEVDEATMKARCGTNLPYGKYLELGTKRGILPRPWLRRALAETSTEVNSILGQVEKES